MKHLINCTLAFVLLTICSCEKSETTYSQEQLNGTWEALELNSLGCIQQLKIHPFGLSEIKICDGIPIEFEAENYLFDGKIIKYELYGLKFEFQISELTDTKLLLGVHEPMEYRRVSE